MNFPHIKTNHIEFEDPQYCFKGEYCSACFCLVSLFLTVLFAVFWIRICVGSIFNGNLYPVSVYGLRITVGSRYKVLYLLKLKRTGSVFKFKAGSGAVYNEHGYETLIIRKSV